MPYQPRLTSPGLGGHEGPSTPQAAPAAQGQDEPEGGKPRRKMKVGMETISPHTFKGPEPAAVFKFFFGVDPIRDPHGQLVVPPPQADFGGC